MRPTLPAARGSSHLAAIAESLVTDAERSNRRVTCLLHITSDGTRVRHAQGITLSILRAFIACAVTVQTAMLVLFGPSCLGQYMPLQLLHAHCLGLLLFERSEFPIDTSKKKSLRVCPCARVHRCSTNLGFSVGSANRLRPKHGIPLPV